MKAVDLLREDSTFFINIKWVSSYLMRKRCKAKCLFPLYCSEYSDTWCGCFCELCNNPWIEKLKSSCQIMEGFELKVIWIWMEFYSSAKFCSKVPSVGCWGCFVEIAVLLIWFFSFHFSSALFTFSFQFFICFQFFFQQLGWLFVHFFSTAHMPIMKQVVSRPYIQSSQHGLLAQNEISCILATELMYETCTVNLH